MEKKRVAIIGAGVSGLGAIKCCLDEGLTPVCFERTDHVGGLWYYTPKAYEGEACVMKSTVINTSKEMMCWSDFPIPGDFPNYMHNTKVQEYNELYMKKFKLDDHILFRTEILSVKKAADFSSTGQWKLEIKDLEKNTVRHEIFDALFVCTGHHADKYFPDFKGLNTFKGKYVHTHDYKDHVGFENKRVVVVGIGNSGGDVAVELGRVAKQVYLSTRKGSWVFNRVYKNGLPIDMAFSTRLNTVLKDLLPYSIINLMQERELNSRFDHEKYGLRPKHRPLSAHPTVNDDLPNRILCGSVIVKSNIKSIKGDSVEFDDGTVVENIDAIVFATGYIFGFPFLDEGIVTVKKNQVDLYKHIFPPDLEKPTLAVIGCFQPWGAITPMSEMQCRWATRVFSGLTKLPSCDEMWQDINLKRKEMSERYVESQRHTIQVDYLPYMDEMAEHVGCKPDLKELLLSDPVLAFKVFFDSGTPYQFRLHGPHSWSGARQAIMTQWQRVFETLHTRKAEPAPILNNSIIWIALFVIIAIVFKLFFM